MEDADLAFSPVWRLQELLDNRAVSSVELTELFLRRIEALNPQLNVFLTVTAEEALAAARFADEKLSQGENDMPLVGGYWPIGKGFTATQVDQVRGLRLAWSPDLGYAAIDPEDARDNRSVVG